MSHWIIMPVVLPAVIGAMLVMLMQRDVRFQRAVGLAATAALVAVAGVLLWAADTRPPEVYLLGNWPAPFGIVLVLDRLSALMLVLTSGLALAVQTYAAATGWDARGRHFHALFLFQLMGLNGAFLTGDAFNLFVFFEVLLIASYGLMIHGGGQDRLRAGVQYVAYNLVGSTLFLFALATIYGVTGTLNMADLAGKVAALPAGDAALIRVAAVLLMLVFAIKGALVPLHFWLPGTYAHAPGPVAALFAVMTKVGAYAVIRVGTLIFPPATPATGTLIADLLGPAALATLALGAIGVLGAVSLQRMVAFAAIASMGTVFIAVAQFTPQATAAALYYTVHSTFAAAILFLVADQVSARRASDSLQTAQPPMAQSGLLAALFFTGCIAMAGMPPLSGFVGKLLILDATRDGQIVLIWGAILTTSLIIILGFARAGSLMFWKSHASGAVQTGKAEPVALAVIIALISGLVALTVFAGPTMRFIAATAAGLHAPAAYVAAHHLGATP